MSSEWKLKSPGFWANPDRAVIMMQEAIDRKGVEYVIFLPEVPTPWKWVATFEQAVAEYAQYDLAADQAFAEVTR